MIKAALSGSMQSMRLHFNWIDMLVVPIATSIMEAQPFAIVLLFVTLLLTGNSAIDPLTTGSIILLMLGLHWWAQLAGYMKRRRIGNIRTELFQYCGLLLAFALTIVTHLVLLNNVLFLLLVAALVLWFWVRGRRRVQGEFTETQLLFSFKLCFTVLLVVLLITILLSHAIAVTMFAAIAIAFPLYFLSGLVAISFLRLSATIRESKQDASSTIFERTHVWSLFLMLTWSLLVAVVILLELFAFQPLLTILTPLINAVLSILQFFRLKPSVQHIAVKPTPTPVYDKSGYAPPVAHPTINPLILLALFAILGAIVLGGIILVLIAAILARDKSSVEQHETFEEERKTLDVRSTLNDRRKRNQERKAKFQLEPLNPDSVRMRYRDLLLATVRREDLQRRLDETPTEYQQRLRRVVASLPYKEDEPANTTILTELTETYMLERYGRRQTTQAQAGYFKKWVQRLVKRIKLKTKRNAIK
jgi:hypothetical protein